MSNDSKIENMTCAACAASPSTCADNSSPNVVAKFGIPKKLQTFKRGATIFNEGDDFSGMYCLKSGLVALKKYHLDGSSAVVRMIKPGEIFGYRSFLVGTDHQAAAETLSPCEICSVSRSSLNQMMMQNPGIQQELIKQMGRDMEGIEHLFVLTMTKSIQSRLAHFLLGVAAHINPNDNQVCFDLPMHKKDVAAIIGVAVESLSRILARFKEQGMIEENRGEVTILDREALHEFAEKSYEHV